jgi:integrase
MAKTLTVLGVKNARARGVRRELADGGCCGLYLVVQPSGVKSWAARYRSRRRSVKFTLGSVLIGAAESGEAPQLGAPLSLADARELCARVLREAKAGRDPAAERRQQRELEHAGASDSLQGVCEEHLRREAPRLRTLGQRRADLELFYGSLGQLPLDQIKRGQFIRVLDAVADQRGQRRAGRALAAMKTLLNWHGNRSDYVSVLTRTSWRAQGPPGGRDRILDDAELRATWLAAEQDKGVFGRYLQFTLLTCARRSESAGLRISELSDDRTVWTIPAARYKTKHDVTIPLSTAAQRILAAMPARSGGDYVFSATGARPFNNFAFAKAAFDKASGTSNWRIHDVRRTARTLLSRAGVFPDIAERCLGHRVGGIRGVYDRHRYEAEMRQAFEALAVQIERIAHPRADVVVPIRRARRRK